MKSVKLVSIGIVDILLCFKLNLIKERKRKYFGHSLITSAYQSFLGLSGMCVEFVEVDKTAIHVMHNRHSIYSKLHCLKYIILLWPEIISKMVPILTPIGCCGHVRWSWMVHHVLPVHSEIVDSHHAQCTIVQFSCVKAWKKTQKVG